jgi:hypothetical protein
MRIVSLTATLAALSTAALCPSALAAQGGMDHSKHAEHMAMPASSAMPAGQDVFAAVSAVVAKLEADSTTDWSKVNIEALRRHLIAMNDVALGASVVQTEIPGGARMEITGEGRVAESIRAVFTAHAPELAAMGTYRASVESIPRGVRLVVTAADPNDAHTAAKIRGLGFMGLWTLGSHHEPHHLALARGQSMSGHKH